MSFASLGLHPEILKAIDDKGYDTPSPIQQQAIPAVIEGKDVMAAAQTGTGKTAGFTLPILQGLIDSPRVKPNQAKVLVLTPTRELAAQIRDNVEHYSKYMRIRSVVVFGGVKINPQMMVLRKGADILVATPGRLLDLYQQNAVKFEQLQTLVLDEADRMLDMGFIHDIKKILKLLPAKRQNLLFSATFSDDIRQLAKGLVHDPIEIDVAPRNTTAQTVEQLIYPVDKGKKTAVLIDQIKQHNWQQVLVFSKTKHGANRICKKLVAKGITAAAIHGNKSQAARTKALADFKSGEVRIMVATDIAARGLDISQLPYVINYDLPHVAEDYVHRIGRTGRAGANGQAISLVCAEEFKELKGIERLIQKQIPRQEIAGFEPEVALGQAVLDTRPAKPKKPKKPKTSDGKKQQNANGEGNKAAKPQRRRRPANNTNTANSANNHKGQRRVQKPQAKTASA